MQYQIPEQASIKVDQIIKLHGENQQQLPDIGIDILINGQQHLQENKYLNNVNRYAIDCSGQIDVSALLETEQQGKNSENIESSQQLNVNQYINKHPSYKQPNILDNQRQEKYLENEQLYKFEINYLKKTNSNEQTLVNSRQKYPLIKYQKGQNFKAVSSVLYTELNKQLENAGIALSQIKKIHTIKRNKQSERIYLLQCASYLLIFQKGKLIKIAYDDQIQGISIKPDQKFVLIYFSKHILIYEVLIDIMKPKKHLTDLPVDQITSAIFLNSSSLQFILCDNQYKLLHMKVNQGYVFGDKLKIEEIKHDNDVVGNIDYINYEGYDLLVIASSTQLQIITKKGANANFISKQLINIDFNSKKLIQALWIVNNNKKLGIVAAVRGNVYVYEQTNLLSQVQYQFQLIKLFHSHNQLLKLSLLCDTHILIDYIDRICMITLKQIPKVAGFKYESKMASQICLDCTFNSKAKFVWQMQKVNQNCRLLTQQLNYLDSEENRREFIIIDRNVDKDTLVICQLQKLEEKVRQLVIEGRAYYEGFKILIRAYKGLSFSYYFDYNDNTFLNKLIQQSFRSCLKSITFRTDSDQIMNRILWMCQLVIECQRQQLIWDELFPRLTQVNLSDMFLQLSHIFILDDELKLIPQQVLYLLIEYHATLFHQIVLEKLLLKDHIYDPLRIISLIQSKKLYYLQFYVFSKEIFNDSSEYDFYTPFIRVFSVLKATNDWQAGMSALWFLHKCFMFQTVEKHSYIMTPSQKKSVITNFIVQITNPSIIDVLIDFSPKLAIEILSIPLVKQQFIDLLDERMEQNTKLYETLTHNKSDKQFIDIYFEHILEKCQKMDKMQHMEFIQFFCIGFYNQCSPAFNWNAVYENVKILLLDKQIYWTLNFPKKHTIPKLQYVIIKMIDYLCRTAPQNQQDAIKKKEQLLSIKQTKFLFCIYRLNKQYKSSLEVLMRFPSQYYHLFDFIMELFEDVAKQDQAQQETSLQSIKMFLTGNLRQLLLINRQKTICTCNKIGLSNQDIYDIIIQSQNQQTMVFFILGLLEKYGSKPFLKKKMFLQQYAKLVSAYPMKKMIAFVKVIQSDQEQAIEVMMKINNKVGAAILYENVGKVGRAIELYQQLLKQQLSKDTDPDNYQFVEDMSFYLKKCLKLGIKTTNPEIWVDILILSSTVMERLQVLSDSKVFLIAKTIRSRLIHSIFNQLPTSFVLQVFTIDKFYQQKELRTEFFSTLMRKICICIKFDMILYNQVEKISKIDTNAQRKIFFKKNFCGYQSKAFCQFCNEKLSCEDQSCIYSCGHSYHLICHNDPSVCLECSYLSKSKEMQRCLFSDNLLSIQNDLYIHLSKVQADLFTNPQQIAKQRKLTLLKQFDDQVMDFDAQIAMAYENPKNYYHSIQKQYHNEH